MRQPHARSSVPSLIITVFVLGLMLCSSWTFASGLEGRPLCRRLGPPIRRPGPLASPPS